MLITCSASLTLQFLNYSESFLAIRHLQQLYALFASATQTVSPSSQRIRTQAWLGRLPR